MDSLDSAILARHKTRMGLEFAIIQLDRDLCINKVMGLRHQVDELIAKNCLHFILDFEQVKYIDSSGLGFIIYLQKTLDKKGGRLSLVKLSREALRCIKYAQILERIPSAALLAAAQEHKERLLTKPSNPGTSSSIKVPKDPKRMSEVRAQVSELLESCSLDEQTVFDSVLAVGEALGNAFDHAFSDSIEQLKEHEAMSIIVNIDSYEDRVVIEVLDSGKGCDFSSGDLPDISLTRGRGIRLMHLLMDQVEIVPREHGCGTCVRLVKLKL